MGRRTIAGIVALLALVVTPALASSITSPFATPFESLAAAAVTGAGLPISSPRNVGTYSLQVDTTGSPAACVVTLQGTVDGTTWVTLATWSSLTTGTIVSVTGSQVVAVRANLTTLSGGTSPTVSAWIAL